MARRRLKAEGPPWGQMRGSKRVAAVGVLTAAATVGFMPMSLLTSHIQHARRALFEVLLDCDFVSISKL